jgi:integrase
MLTDDNPLLSRPKTALEDEQSQLPQDISDTVRKYVSQSLSENTRRAYRADLDHFIAWGGSIPCPAETLAEYLAAHADKLAPATLVRRIASIGKAHASVSKPNPAETELVRATIRGIKRHRSKAQTQAKPLLKEDLFAVLHAMGEDIHATRDKALLLVGFASAMRRSELVALNVEHVEHVQQGLIITVPRSKADQEGNGRKIGIPYGRTRWCPVNALRDWLSASSINAGPTFRPVSKHGHISPDRLNSGSVTTILRRRLEVAGFDPAPYSGHSLRAGLATSAAAAGVSSWKIRQQTGHASDATLCSIHPGWAAI